MPSRFEANFSDPQVNLDPFIDEVFSELKSGFLELPKGEGVRRVSCFRGGLSIPQEGDRRIHSLGGRSNNRSDLRYTDRLHREMKSNRTHRTHLHKK
jgi:hypothetical protein